MSQNKTKILMCPPDFFEVDYAINPWMIGNENNLDVELAKQQWNNLKQTIEQFADVEVMPPADGLPDIVFTANAGVVVDNKAMVSRFKHPERQGEEPLYEAAFRKLGFDIVDLPEEIKFEGAGDSLMHRGGDWVWSGYGFRTDLESHQYLKEFYQREIVSVKLVDARFYHIDTCMCPLYDGYLMYHPPAFDFDSRLAIESRVPSHKRIVVDTADAGNFACNAVNIGRNIIVNKASDYLKARVMRDGFKLHEVDLSEFLKAGGSAKCLTLKLNEGMA
ncbi:MAG: hypothetical protein HKN88_02970 [Gammaproteobacteria bacterium]|nr:dimethylarginine dimethylaminohydrolase family protein [Gammaproteobacteria bacterium]NNC97015.1 hypothetical protein [Gammaproteobacteria bacterium]NNM14374.1 hypothetical protein [Gammaproteobacteria bacterium]